MRRADWSEVKRLFHAALDRPAHERAAFVADSSASAEVREEVQSLLREDADAGTFLEESAFEVVGGTAAGRDEVAVEGRRVGPWRLVREIGRGGMGAVYFAERADRAYSKQVAVKLIKRGMDTDLIIRRFRHERQILAQLDHPNIARFLDGGTTQEDTPYFVMEYIDGERIDRYCTARRLPLADRLRLFRSVCAAVEFAHRNLIVHRDIKPSNILVTHEGVPMLLDFGLARVLDPGRTTGDTALSVGAGAFTPEYASPEQVRGNAITTASDVYSLGVLLYELTTERRPYPFASRSPEEAARLVCGHHPDRPSVAADWQWGDARLNRKLRRTLRGDVDTIVAAAMRKDPAHRYATAAALSDDVRRYLKGLPLVARTEPARIRAIKLVLSPLGGAGATLQPARVAAPPA